MDFHDDLMFHQLSVPNRDALLETLGQAVIDRGMAKDTYVDALKSREAEFPTGLPIAGGVAIPHTAAEYVTANTIVAASLAEPVVFAEMGGEAGSEIAVSVVLLLVFADSTQHLPLLSKLVRQLQKGDLAQSLREAPDASAMSAVLAEILPN